jgi:hypothetical protein
MTWSGALWVFVSTRSTPDFDALDSYPGGYTAWRSVAGFKLHAACGGFPSLFAGRRGVTGARRFALVALGNEHVSPMTTALLRVNRVPGRARRAFRGWCLHHAQSIEPGVAERQPVGAIRKGSTRAVDLIRQGSRDRLAASVDHGVEMDGRIPFGEDLSGAAHRLLRSRMRQPGTL